MPLTRLSAACRRIVDGDACVPVLLPGVLATLGQADRAVALAESITAVADRAAALVELTRALAAAGARDRARAVAGRAVQATRSIGHTGRRTGLRVELVRVLAAAGEGAPARQVVDLLARDVDGVA